MVEGPDGNLWCIYTTLVRIHYKFERRIAMDPVGFDADGNMFIAGPTETPQLAPGVSPSPAEGNDAGLWPLSINEFTRASSFRAGHEPMYAVDNYIRTWWEAEKPEPQWLMVDLSRDYEVHAVRTMFADCGLDYDAGVVPGPYQYLLEGSVNGREWFVLCDQSANRIDRHIAYDPFAPKRARYVRLTVLAVPPGMRAGVWEFTVFGCI